MHRPGSNSSRFRSSANSSGVSTSTSSSAPGVVPLQGRQQAHAFVPPLPTFQHALLPTQRTPSALVQLRRPPCMRHAPCQQGLPLTPMARVAHARGALLKAAAGQEGNGSDDRPYMGAQKPVTFTASVLAAGAGTTEASLAGWPSPEAGTAAPQAAFQPQPSDSTASVGLSQPPTTTAHVGGDGPSSSGHVSSGGGIGGDGGNNSNANGNGQATEHVPLRRKLYYGSMTFLQVLRNFTYRTLVLFLLGGSVLAWLLVNWARGSALQLSNPYVFNVTFPVAPSLERGVPLRMKGVQVGSVTKATVGLEYVEAAVEVNQKSLRIPRASKLVYNKAGPLSPAPFIEVQLPRGLNEVPTAQVMDVLSGTGSKGVAEGAGAVSGAGAARGGPEAASAMASEAEEVGASAATGGAVDGAAQQRQDQQNHEQRLRKGLSIAAAAAMAKAGPEHGDACRAEGLLLCAGDRVQGVQGGGMDELTALMLKNMKRGADDPQCLPPVLRQLVAKERAEEAERAKGDGSGARSSGGERALPHRDGAWDRE